MQTLEWNKDHKPLKWKTEDKQKKDIPVYAGLWHNKDLIWYMTKSSLYVYYPLYPFLPCKLSLLLHRTRHSILFFKLLIFIFEVLITSSHLLFQSLFSSWSFTLLSECSESQSLILANHLNIFLSYLSFTYMLNPDSCSKHSSLTMFYLFY